MQAFFTVLMACVMALWAGPARANTPIALFKSFAGNVNFVGTQETMRNRDNSRNPCSMVDAKTTLKARLSGIPANAEILSAYLYWAGSNSKDKADYTVTFEGAEVTAPASRQYFSTTIGNGYSYFGGAVEVTTQVATKRNGDYTFSGLTVNSGSPYCNVQGVVGGYSLLVVYSDASEPFRVLNVYEGFQYVRQSSVTLNLSNFLVPNPLPAASTGRLGHITWEGDSTLRQNGETLSFNDVEMTDSMNPSGNQFNSASNINGDSSSYGIDFDAYTIRSPVIKAGDVAAKTVYRSGQDLVLLNAEIIAVPNVPTADMVMTITRNGELQAGRVGTYTLSASNAGPSTERGPVTVTATLSNTLNYISATGSTWDCKVSGKVVTCTAPGPLAKGASLPPVTLAVQPTATGTATLTAKLTGQLFDNILSNNTATNTSTVVEPRAGGYVLTVGACVPNIAFGELGQTCSLFGGSMTAGSPTALHVTATSILNLPVAVSMTRETTVPVRFSLSCINPFKTAGTTASFDTFSVPACAEGDAMPPTSSKAWSAPASLSFAANKASAMVGAKSQFIYDDVGEIKLNVDASGLTTATTVVSKPEAIYFIVRRKRSTDPEEGVPNPAILDSTRNRGFVMAGERFILGIAARTASKRNAPNFGNEEGLQVAIEQPEAPQPKLTGNFHTHNAGVRLGDDFVWDQAGWLEITPVLVPASYLGAGPVPLEKQSVGRFYPAWLETSVPSPFACLPAMRCPALGVAGAAYSQQPFEVTVSGFSLLGTRLANYTGDAAPGIKLQAVDAPGGLVLNPGGGVLDPASAAGGTASPNYRLTLPYSTARPKAEWGAPVSIYLRALVDEIVTMGPDKTANERISSIRTLAADSVEGGIRIVNGRIQLSNVYGSELLKMPIRMNAQFWSGTGWVNNTKYELEKLDYAAQFSVCTDKLFRNGACNADLLKAQPAWVKLIEGAATLWLDAPGRGNTGSTQLSITASPANTFPWLPSTRARVVFGNYPKSPVIYMREMY